MAWKRILLDENTSDAMVEILGGAAAIIIYAMAAANPGRPELKSIKAAAALKSPPRFKWKKAMPTSHGESADELVLFLQNRGKPGYSNAQSLARSTLSSFLYVEKRYACAISTKKR